MARSELTFKKAKQRLTYHCWTCQVCQFSLSPELQSYVVSEIVSVGIQFVSETSQQSTHILMQ